VKKRHPILRRVPGARQWIEKIERLEAERDRLSRRVERLQGLLDNVPPPVARREEYKDVWSELSATRNSARLHVGGFEEEEIFEATGAKTKETLLVTVGLNSQDTVVEIGCGVGRVGKPLAGLCRKWIGCDVSPNMLRFAAERLQGLDNVELREINGYDLQPLADASADVVYSTIVFMHLEEWDRYNFVLEAYRVLRPGGRLYVDNVNLCSQEGWEVFERHREFAPKERPAYITKCSTPAELATYLKRAGFKSVQCQEDGLWIRAWGVKADRA